MSPLGAIQLAPIKPAQILAFYPLRIAGLDCIQRPLLLEYWLILQEWAPAHSHDTAHLQLIGIRINLSGFECVTGKHKEGTVS